MLNQYVINNITHQRKYHPRRLEKKLTFHLPSSVILMLFNPMLMPISDLRPFSAVTK